jgi:hypothetical protein
MRGRAAVALACVAALMASADAAPLLPSPLARADAALRAWLPAPGAAAPAEPLEQVVAGYAALLGAPAPAAGALDGLPAGARPALASILSTMKAAELHRRALLAAGLSPASPSFAAALRQDAATVLAAVERALPALRAQAPRVAGQAVPPTVEAWPVLAYDEAGDTAYRLDYALIVDRAGNDLYDDNAAGPFIAVAPQGDPNSYTLSAPVLVPGTNDPVAAVGGEFEFAALLTGVSVLVDAAGSDTYGVKKAPFLDAQCGPDMVVRRVSTQGAGLASIGLLLDTVGDDVYTAKTESQGAGHVGGVGLLLDLGGNDQYTAVRNAQGQGLIGGLGVLLDQEGGDAYVEDMPPGGVLSDRRVCDPFPRNVQGAGVLGGTGVLLEMGGDDRYVAAAASQGSGTGGVGVLEDQGGLDSYTVPGRADGTRLVSPIVGVFDDAP